MNDRPNPIRDKSYAFALEIVVFCEMLFEKRHFVIANQLLKSGTSIGANVREAQHGQSKKDFISKLNISLKEAEETIYWLSIIGDVHFVTKEQTEPFLAKARELAKLLTSIINSTKKNCAL